MLTMLVNSIKLIKSANVVLLQFCSEVFHKLNVVQRVHIFARIIQDFVNDDVPTVKLRFAWIL